MPWSVISGTGPIPPTPVWSSDVAEKRKFVHALLEKNPTLNKPKRLFIDIESAMLGRNLPKLTYINDHLLTQARAGQYSPHTVRVVVDIKSFDNYKIFSLNDPFRVVVDVWAKKETAAVTAQSGTAVPDTGGPPERVPLPNNWPWG